MLRNRSRAVTKQSLMADHNSVPASKSKQTASNSSFLGSPRFFNGFFSKGVTNFEPVKKPAPVLGSPRISDFGSSFGCYDNMVKSPRAGCENREFSAEKMKIGLALINDDKSLDQNLEFTRANSCTRAQLGSKLRIQIPSPPGSNTQSWRFSDDLLTPSSGLNSEVQAQESPIAISTTSLSWSEMELSEDYTCVISHGPNPKTTRIFDNCIVESCCGVVALSDLKKDYNLSSPSQSFLSSCHTCNKSLGDGSDIYMYRGEKAFCSNECRCEEIFLDEMENSEMENGF